MLAPNEALQIPAQSRNGWWKIRLLDESDAWIRVEEVWTEPEKMSLERTPSAWRARVVETARAFLGDPYYWGGRSAYDPEAVGTPHRGVDCSGLIGLAFQAAGAVIPRDAHEQWMNARKISRQELQPADLIFLSDPNSPERISHVLLYAGNGKAIEAPATGGAVREISLEERLQKEPSRSASYGSYLPRVKDR